MFSIYFFFIRPPLPTHTHTSSLKKNRFSLAFTGGRSRPLRSGYDLMRIPLSAGRKHSGLESPRRFGRTLIAISFTHVRADGTGAGPGPHGAWVQPTGSRLQSRTPLGEERESSIIWSRADAGRVSVLFSIGRHGTNGQASRSRKNIQYPVAIWASPFYCSCHFLIAAVHCLGSKQTAGIDFLLCCSTRAGPADSLVTLAALPYSNLPPPTAWAPPCRCAVELFALRREGDRAPRDLGSEEGKEFCPPPQKILFMSG